MFSMSRGVSNPPRVSGRVEQVTRSSVSLPQPPRPGTATRALTEFAAGTVTAFLVVFGLAFLPAWAGSLIP